MVKKHIKSLITAILIPLAVGVVAALIASGSIAEYSNMPKPVLTPFSWPFPVV